MTRPTREEMEDQLVELLSTQSSSDAKRLAERLRAQGILAIANAEPYRARTSNRAWATHYDTFVLVHENDYEEAVALLDELFGTEGNVPEDLIHEEMAAAEEDPEAAYAWYHENKREERQRDRRMTIVAALLVAVISAVLYVAQKL